MKMVKLIPFKIDALCTSIGLAGFSGTVATIGLARFCPGAEPVVIVMGALFELAKLSAFAMVHKTLPRTLKAALITVGLECDGRVRRFRLSRDGNGDSVQSGRLPPGLRRQYHDARH